MRDRQQSIIYVHGLMSRGREKMRNVLSLSSMQSFSVKQWLYAKLCGFCQAHKTLCLFQAHKAFYHC
jgi:hypothetical protein